ncbi:MAG: hypothetical protein JEZ04_06605 [Spirochaetales bacterium]|nr:hypothetical protein [Spirochaetales bacterium]
MTSESCGGNNKAVSIPLFFVSLSIILFELSLIKSLSYLKFSHFTYLVISIALLGFCASGTLISLLRDSFLKKGQSLLNLLLILQVLSYSACYPVSWNLAPDSFFFLSPGAGFLTLIPFIILLFMPFFIAGLITGLVLLLCRRNTGLLYGINLVGSGAGGAVFLLLMFYVEPGILPFSAAAPAAAAAAIRFISSAAGQKRAVLLAVMVSVLIPAFFFISPAAPRPKIDQYKAGAYIRELEKQDMAELVCSRSGAQGMIECFKSDTFHDTLFAGLMNPHAPPAQLSVLIDGEKAGTIFTGNSRENDGILDYTPQAVPYSLFENPRVLLLGEVGGTNIRLARRMGARRITVVQPDSVLVDLLLNDLKGYGGEVFFGEDVRVVTVDPRAFLEHTEQRFDIIHFSEAEGMPAFSGGIYSLNEDYLLTTEAAETALRILSAGGVVSVVRGLQRPPRDSLRIFSTFHAALERGGWAAPDENLLMMENYLASLTMASGSAFSRDRINQISAAAERSGSRIIFPGDGQTEDSDTLRRGISLILEGEPRALRRGYIFDITPPTDSRPYFHHFFRLRSLKWIRDNYSDLYLYHTELGYLILLSVLVSVIIFSILLLTFPLLRLGKAGEGRRSASAVSFFLLIGFGFMFFEMVCIQRFSLFIGDPVISASAVIISILIASGAGSIVQAGLKIPVKRRIRFASVILPGLMLVFLFFLDDIFGCAVSMEMEGRYLLSVLLLLPPSFFMGWFFAPALENLHRTNRRLVPLAWGINGAASVVAAPLATLFLISFGSVAVGVAAMVLYACVLPAVKGF